MFCRTPSEMIWHFVCKLKRLNLCRNFRLRRRRRRRRRRVAGVRIHHHHHHHRYQHWIATKLLQLFLSSSDSAIRVFISPFQCSQQQIFYFHSHCISFFVSTFSHHIVCASAPPTASPHTSQKPLPKSLCMM